MKDASPENSIMLEKSGLRAVWSRNYWQKFENLGKSSGSKCWTFRKWYGWRSCSWSTLHTVKLLTLTSLATLRVLAWGFVPTASRILSSSWGVRTMRGCPVCDRFHLKVPVSLSLLSMDAIVVWCGCRRWGNCLHKDGQLPYHSR